MRILWHSAAPWAPTGYGVQTAIWCDYLKEQGHTVAISTYFGSPGNERKWHGMEVYPPPQDGIVTSLLTGHIQRFKPDVVVILADVWIMNPKLFTGVKTVAWVPCDATPLSVGDTNFLMHGLVKPIAMAEAGKQTLESAGMGQLWPSDEVPVIPHAIDTEIFRPAADRRALRAAYGIEDDQFVIGMNFNNIDPVRKGVPEQFWAFTEFRKKHPEAVLLVHSMIECKMSLNLQVLATTLGIQDVVRISDQYRIQAGMFPPEEMARWYSVLDVFSNTTYGEGFGIPAIEAQACGTPVILSDNTTGPQLKGSGWLVPTEPYWNPVHQSWWGRPSPKGILRAYERAFERRNAPMLRQACRTFAQDYDIRVVGPMWTELLEEVHDAR